MCFACGADLCDILYSKLFSAREKQKDYGKISWNLGESDRSTSRNSDSVLLLLINSDFYGIYQCGPPLGVTFSFLISSPMVDLGSLVLLMSVFGGKIAFAYVIVGLVIAVIGGTIIERLHMEDQVADFIRQAPNVEVASPSLTIADRMDYAKNQVVVTVKKVAPYIVVGVIIGAAIHNLIPEHIVRSILGKQTWYAVPLATAVGVPMYADIFGTIPVAESLLAKGQDLEQFYPL